MSSSSTFSGGSDEFTHGVHSFMDALAKRSKLLLGLGIAVIVIAGVGVFIVNQKEQKSDAGRNALFLAQKDLDKQLDTLAKSTAPAETKTDAKAEKDKKPAPPVTADTIQFKKFDVDTQLADSVKKLTAVANDYSSTRSGFEAKLMLAKLYLNHGDPAKAADWFKKSTENAPAALDRALAWESVGLAHENEGKAKEALDAFEKALSVNETAIKGDLLLDKARALETLNDTAQAKTVYEQIKTQFPSTDYAKSAELFEARLK